MKKIFAVAWLVGVVTAVAGTLMPEMVLMGIVFGLLAVAVVATRENHGHWVLAIGIAVALGIAAALFFKVQPVQKGAFVVLAFFAALTMIGVGCLVVRNAERNKHARRAEMACHGGDQ